MSSVNLRLFCWLPAKKLEGPLHVYEKVAFEAPVSDAVLRRTNKYLASVIRAEIKRCQTAFPADEGGVVDFDVPSTEEIDMSWVWSVVRDLEVSRSRQDMVIALDTFFSHYHESFSEATRMHPDQTVKDILHRLDELKGN